MAWLVSDGDMGWKQHEITPVACKLLSDGFWKLLSHPILDATLAYFGMNSSPMKIAEHVFKRPINLRLPSQDPSADFPWYKQTRTSGAAR